MLLRRHVFPTSLTHLPNRIQNSSILTRYSTALYALDNLNFKIGPSFFCFFLLVLLNAFWWRRRRHGEGCCKSSSPFPIKSRVLKWPSRSLCRYGLSKYDVRTEVGRGLGGQEIPQILGQRDVEEELKGSRNPKISQTSHMNGLLPSSFVRHFPEKELR